MTILDGKNPRVFMPLPTSNGQWMVVSVLDGAITIEPGFFGDEDSAKALAAIRNKAELSQYAADSSAQVK
ncbi:MAG TPA: hypothetical protein VIQ05_23235 [Tardiphaga sp.]